MTVPLNHMLRALALTALLSLCLQTARGAAAPAAAAPVPADPKAALLKEIMERAHKAFILGKRTNAFLLADEAIKLAPENPQPYFTRGKLHQMALDHEAAVKDFTEAIQRDPKTPDLYLERAWENFCAAHAPESVRDYDKVIELAPRQAPYLWQRGIALYYAGRYNDGRLQFEQHQTVNPQDAENAAWHYLCVAKIAGPEKARAVLIPIQADDNMVMMDIYGLYRGTKKPAEVLAAAHAEKPKPEDLKVQLFYTYLYLALYFDANGDASRAREFINLSLTVANSRNPMSDVARIHAKLMGDKPAASPSPASTPEKKDK
jgi:lipoprotein NlpI